MELRYMTWQLILGTARRCMRRPIYHKAQALVFAVRDIRCGDEPLLIEEHRAGDYKSQR